MIHPKHGGFNEKGADSHQIMVAKAKAKGEIFTGLLFSLGNGRQAPPCGREASLSPFLPYMEANPKEGEGGYSLEPGFSILSHNGEQSGIFSETMRYYHKGETDKNHHRWVMS